MNDSKTVGDAITTNDPLYTQQKNDVAKMRTALLACNGDLTSTKVALQQVTVLRVYHQVTRIIRYLDEMDKIENKLYETIDHTLETIQPNNLASLNILLNIQERLQKSMIESQKLLQPYLDIETFNIVDLTIGASTAANASSADMIMDSDSRNKLRTAAQSVLLEIDSGGSADG